MSEKSSCASARSDFFDVEASSVIRRHISCVNMATVCLRSHKDISGGRETLPVAVDESVCLLDRGLLDFMVLIQRHFFFSYACH